MSNLSLKFPVALLVLALFIGCTEKRPDGLPKLYPCKIKVIQDGAPLQGAAVTLIFTEDSRPEKGTWLPMAVTDADGSAVIRTNGLYDGAPVGKFKVLVTRQSTEMKTKAGPTPEGDAAYAASLNQPSTVPDTFDLVDPKFGNAVTTPQEFEIAGKGPNELTVDVGKAVKVKVRN